MFACEKPNCQVDGAVLARRCGLYEGIDIRWAYGEVKIGVQADAGGLDVSVKKEEGITRVRFVPEEPGHLQWNVKFTKSNE